MRSERGFTLIEMLIAMPLGILVVGSVMYFMVVSLDQGNAISSRTSSAIQAQVGLDKLTQDLSEAIASNSVTMSQTATTTTVTFDIPNPSSGDLAEVVTWTCPYSAVPVATSVGTCTRQVASGSVVQQMAGVESATFAPVSAAGSPITLTSTPTALTPAYIGITLNMAVISQRDPTQTATVAGDQITPIVLKAGVDLRNFT